MRLTEVECDPAVPGRTATLLFAPPLSAAERVRLLAKGKELFLDRCARCHGENGDKPLTTGVPLSDRRLTGDVIARAVKGRLADGTDENDAASRFILAVW